MDMPSATMTEQERMKLIKWAKKNGAARISVEGVEIEFAQRNDRLPALDPGIFAPLETPTIPEEVKAAIYTAKPTYPEYSSDSTKKAMAALRSQMDDPDVFATRSDEWANQTRLPRS